MADFEHQQSEIGLESCADAPPNVIISAKVLINLRKTPK